MSKRLVANLTKPLQGTEASIRTGAPVHVTAVRITAILVIIRAGLVVWTAWGLSQVISGVI